MGIFSRVTELMPTSVRAELENRHTFSHNQIISISLDVARALNYLHLMQPNPIIHRDITSASVLLELKHSNSWRAKVSDYGLFRLFLSSTLDQTHAPIKESHCHAVYFPSK